MKKGKMLAMMLVAIFAFSACGTDEEAGESTKLPEIFTGKRVAQISYKSSDKNEDIEAMTYVNNKLTKYTDVEISEHDGRYEWVYDVTYSGDQVKTYCKYADSKDSEETLYTLNAEGYAISAKITDIEDEREEGLFTYVTNQTFEYANGYLVKIVSTDDDGEVTTMQINYSDGDVTSFSEERGTKRTYTCTPSDILNKGGILPPNNAWFDCDGNLEIGYYAGILGKPTKHLVAKVQESSGYASEYNYTLENEYVKTIRSQFETVTYTFQ